VGDSRDGRRARRRPRLRLRALLGFGSWGFLAGYTWFVGLAASFVVYTALMRSQRAPTVVAEPTISIAEELA
jgi:hypothetical protein